MVREHEAHPSAGNYEGDIKNISNRYYTLVEILQIKINKLLLAIYERLIGLFIMPMLLLEERSPSTTSINERVIEYSFALKVLSELCPQTIIDVGSGRTSWPHMLSGCGFLVSAMDKIDGYWNLSFTNRHYHIIKDDITNPQIEKRFDAATCISVLEHIPNHMAAIEGMFSLLKPGGYLILTFPYSERRYIDNVYKLPGAGYGQDARYTCQVFSRDQIDAWLKNSKAELICQEYYRVFTGEFWTFGERVYPPCEVKKNEKHHLTCIVLRKNL
mgnify:CR=1 FL=1